MYNVQIKSKINDTDVIDKVSVSDFLIYVYVKANKSDITFIEKVLPVTTYKLKQQTMNLYDISDLGPDRNMLNEFANYITFPKMYGPEPVSYVDILICSVMYN